MKQSLNTLPNILYDFVWSDYVELHTLASKDAHFGKEQFVELVLQGQDCACNHPEFTQEDADLLWVKLIEHCQYRKETLTRQYPFTVDADKQGLKLEFVRTQPQQRLYLGILLSANRKHLPQEHYSEITKDFTKVCYELFTQLMPEGIKIQRLPAVLDQFPKHEQVAYIAKTTRGEVLLSAKDYVQDEIELPSGKSEPNKIQPGIVDLLAWHPMGDTRDAIPVAIARCDCESERWLSSQQTLINLDTHFYTRHDSVKYHFSPIDLYNKNKDWALKERLGRVILLDRYRILMLTEEYFIYNDVPDWNLVDLICGSQSK